MQAEGRCDVTCRVSPFMNWSCHGFAVGLQAEWDGKINLLKKNRQQPARTQFPVVLLAFPYNLHRGGVAQVARARVS